MTLCDVIERQWVGEARLDQSQSTRPLRSCRLVRDEQPEVQLCERDDADRDLGLCRDLAGNQDGGIEEQPQLTIGPGIAQPAPERLDVFHQRRVGRQRGKLRERGAVYPQRAAIGAATIRSSSSKSRGPV